MRTPSPVKPALGDKTIPRKTEPQGLAADLLVISRLCDILQPFAAIPTAIYPAFAFMSQADTDYELVIRPNRSWFYVDWKGIWEYRDMLFFLVHRDFVARYKQTVLGPTWFILQPLFMAVIFTVIFVYFAKIPTDDTPPILFYLGGLLGWTYFSQCLITVAGTFITNAKLFGKVYFPRTVVPLSIVISNLLAFALQLLTFLGFWVYYKYFTQVGDQFGMSPYLWLFPCLVLLSACLAFGAGLWMASLTAKYRDLHHMTQFVVQVWMYGSFVVIPVSAVPEQWQWIVYLNPMTVVVEGYRSLFLGTTSLEPQHVLQAVGVTLVILFSGLLFFNRVERDFVDYS